MQCALSAMGECTNREAAVGTKMQLIYSHTLNYLLLKMICFPFVAGKYACKAVWYRVVLGKPSQNQR